MHKWGEKDFDWCGLDEAMLMIVKDLKRWRIGVRDYKEKWGTVRIYCQIGWNMLHDIMYPGHVFRRCPKWLWKFDIFVLSKLIRKLNWIVVPIHKKAYRNAYKKACEKYPHLIDEICSEADYMELLDFYDDNRRTI